MTGQKEPGRVVRAARQIRASADRIFELIADPAQQPRWDGNANLKEAAPGQRVQAVGDSFTMRLTRGGIRNNHVVDFVEGRRIAWRPAVQGKSPPGHLWAWELEPRGPCCTQVTHTYDWTDLTDRSRIPRARATSAEKLQASLDRLAALAEEPEQQYSTAREDGRWTSQVGSAPATMSPGSADARSASTTRSWLLRPGTEARGFRVQRGRWSS
jgi:uncharacterized protein YndB with AHSA1/START domain